MRESDTPEECEGKLKEIVTGDYNIFSRKHRLAKIYVKLLRILNNKNPNWKKKCITTINTEIGIVLSAGALIGARTARIFSVAKK